MDKMYIAQGYMIISTLINATYASNLLTSLGFQTKLQTAMTISFVAYSLALIIFSVSIAIIFYRFAQNEEIVRQSQVESSRKSIQLMNSIRTQMIALKINRILALQESAKKMLLSKKTLMKSSEAIETKLPPMSSRLLNRQRSILLSNSNISTHKKPCLSKPIRSTPHSAKSLMESLKDNGKILRSGAKSLRRDKLNRR